MRYASEIFQYGELDRLRDAIHTLAPDLPACLEPGKAVGRRIASVASVHCLPLSVSFWRRWLGGLYVTDSDAEFPHQYSFQLSSLLTNRGNISSERGGE